VNSLSRSCTHFFYTEPYNEMQESKESDELNCAATAKSDDADQSSISSGRASDGDSDTDSDYSSHDDIGYTPVMNYDHGNYNPREALSQVS